MNQKTLNKIGKYCKAHKYTLGFVVSACAALANTPVYLLKDEVFIKLFNQEYTKKKPKKNRGGYYPKGH